MDSTGFKELKDIFDESRMGALLYHYTSLNNAISILSTRSLLFSPLDRLNDMDESWRPIQCFCIKEDISNRCDEELSSYVQISLTCEDNPEIAAPRRGFDIAPLWGHYADGGNGVCIVLNKCSFIAVVNSINCAHCGCVHYKREYDSVVSLESGNPVKEIKSRINEIFFCKSDQWQHEQEFRIVKKSDRNNIDFIDISECIEGVIYAKLGATSRDESPQVTKGYWALKRVCRGLPLFRYVPFDINHGRAIERDCDGKVIWSAKEVIDLEDESVRILL